MNRLLVGPSRVVQLVGGEKKFKVDPEMSMSSDILEKCTWAVDA